MTRDELLLQLKDIAPPAEPAWWLPGPGHLLLALGLALGVMAFVLWVVHRRSGRVLLEARRDLQRIEAENGRERDAARTAHELSCWLKRVAIRAFPERGLERLNGRQWLEFLDHSYDGTVFSRGPGELFGGEIYRRQPVFDEPAVFDLCRRWLDGIGPRLRRPGAARC